MSNWTCTITTKRPPINRDGTCSSWCPMLYVAAGKYICRWAQRPVMTAKRSRPGKRCPWKSYLTRARVWWDNDGSIDYSYHREGDGTVTMYCKMYDGSHRTVGNYPTINEAITAAWIDHESGRV